MAFDQGLKQHQNMARGNGVRSHESFGCESLASANGGSHSTDGGASGSTLDDGSRAGPPHISRGAGQMPATAHSDHGPHRLP